MATNIGKKIKQEVLNDVEYQRTITEFCLKPRKGEPETIVLMEEEETHRSGKDLDDNKPSDLGEGEESEGMREPEEIDKERAETTEAKRGGRSAEEGEDPKRCEVKGMDQDALVTPQKNNEKELSESEDEGEVGRERRDSGGKRALEEVDEEIEFQIGDMLEQDLHDDNEPEGNSLQTDVMSDEDWSKSGTGDMEINGDN